MTRSIRLKPRLKNAREAKALSQAALGRLLAPRQLPGFKPGHVGLFELGYRDATWSEVEALADVLEVDPQWLAHRDPVDTAAAPAPVVEVGGGLAKAQEPSGVAEPEGSALPPAPAAPPLRLPPAQLPARQSATEAAYRQQLGQLLAEANRLLADRSLAPAEWRAWRLHGENLKAALRAL